MAEDGLVEERREEVFLDGVFGTKLLLAREAVYTRCILHLNAFGERLELRRRRQRLAEHMGSFHLLAEVCKHIGQLLNWKTEVARVDERLALEQLERTLELGQNRIESLLHIHLLRVDLAPKIHRFHRIALIPDRLDQRRHDALGCTCEHGEIASDGAKTLAQVKHALVDKLGSVDTGTPDAQLARLGELRLTFAPTRLAAFSRLGKPEIST